MVNGLVKADIPGPVEAPRKPKCYERSLVLHARIGGQTRCATATGRHQASRNRAVGTARTESRRTKSEPSPSGQGPWTKREPAGKGRKRESASTARLAGVSVSGSTRHRQPPAARSARSRPNVPKWPAVPSLNPAGLPATKRRPVGKWEETRRSPDRRGTATIGALCPDRSISSTDGSELGLTVLRGCAIASTNDLG